MTDFSRHSDPTGLLDTLAGADPCQYRVIGARKPDPQETDLSREGAFVVFPTIKEAVSLRPPVDWAQNPFNSASWQAQLHTLRFFDILFRRHQFQSDVTALREACDIALDWIGSNRRGIPGTSDIAWADKVVGDRAPYLGYLLRTAGANDLLTSDEASTLFESCVEHAHFLLDDTHYTRSSNHGLYQDIGLVLLAGYVDFVPEASQWRKRAIERFSETLSTHLAGDGEGIYLEHSPFYQWLIVNLVRRFEQLAELDDKFLRDTRESLEEDSGWLVFPNGQTPPLGDSDFTPAPDWAVEAGKRAIGMKVFHRAGLASVRTRQSMLLTSAGYHATAHKHADELSFCLFEHGELVLAEAGKYGYDASDPARIYAVSSLAHNSLVIDDEPFVWRGVLPYGSAIRRSGCGAGWHAVEGWNPLLSGVDVTHSRIFIYRPGETLILLDRLAARKPHTYTRLFHFGPGVSARCASPRVIPFSLRTITGVLSDHSEHAVASTIRVGEREPAFAGWFFPEYRSWTPVPTAAFRAEGRDCTFVTVVTFPGDIPDISVAGDLDYGFILTAYGLPGGNTSIELRVADSKTLVIAPM